jgi:hypothetical protein
MLIESARRNKMTNSNQTTAKSLENLSAADAMKCANELCTESDRDQDWESGSTTYTFEDGSRLQVCGTLVKDLRVDPDRSINTLEDLRSYVSGGLCVNDRGNGCAGPHYLAEHEEIDFGYTPVKLVTEQEDPDAWRLAREACAALGVGSEAFECVAIGERVDNGYQAVYAG